MTDIRKILLAGAAGIALRAGPALANDPAIEQAPAQDIQPEGAMELDSSADMEADADLDSVAQLEELGYTDVEPIEAQGDTAAEGEATFSATNPDGERVTVLFDTEAGAVISEDAAY
jgi:hypothetical protein